LGESGPKMWFEIVPWFLFDFSTKKHTYGRVQSNLKTDIQRSVGSTEPFLRELTATLRYLTKQQVKFKWTEEIERIFQEIKAKVMVSYELARETRLYSDSGPEGNQATVAKLHHHPQKGKTWRPEHHNVKAWTTVEKGYSQIEESLGVYSDIVVNRMYLLGTKFVAVVDHKPLLPLYNKITRLKQARVDRHRMKLAAFNFEVFYEPELLSM
jgi:hypothetical protein